MARRCIVVGVGALAMLIGVGAAEARGTCVVSGKKPPPFVVEVTAKEAAPFKLRVDGLPTQVATGGLDAPARATVKGALAFEANVQPGDIPVRTRRAVDATNGMVHLAADTDKLTLHARVGGRWVDADVRLGGGVELHGLVLPCDALTLDDDVPEPKPQLDEDSSPRFIASGKLLHLHGAPGKGGELEVAVDDPSALELKRIEEQGDWMRVTSRWPDGTSVTGWVQKSEVVAETIRHERVGDVFGGLAATCKQDATTREGEHISPAVVATGTQVYAARYIGAWAKVVDGTKLRVRWRAKDDWAEIVGAPGLASVSDCINSTVLLDAWIPKSAAKLPADAPVAGGDGAAVKK